MARQKDKLPPHPITWQVRVFGSNLWCVIDDQAPPLRPGESLLWKGIASHFTEAYRKARASGGRIILTKDGEFKIRAQSRPPSNPSAQ